MKSISYRVLLVNFISPASEELSFSFIFLIEPRALQMAVKYDQHRTHKQNSSLKQGEKKEKTGAHFAHDRANERTCV